MSKPKNGTPDFEGSQEAKRRASLVLEVLGGLRTPPEACEVIGVTLASYYLLEKRAIQGLVKALEPRGKGGARGPRPETQIARLSEERDRLERELQRTQALARVAQRAFGLPSVEKQRKQRAKRRKAAGKKRERKPVVRARKVIDRLKAGGAEEATAKAVEAKKTDAVEPKKQRA